MAVGELDAVAQLERPDGAFRVRLPGGRELRHDLPVLVAVRQPVVDERGVERVLARGLDRRIERVLLAARLDAPDLDAVGCAPPATGHRREHKGSGDSGNGDERG